MSALEWEGLYEHRLSLSHLPVPNRGLHFSSLPDIAEKRYQGYKKRGVSFSSLTFTTSCGRSDVMNRDIPQSRVCGVYRGYQKLLFLRKHWLKLNDPTPLLNVEAKLRIISVAW